MIVGALNWLLMGAFEFDPVAANTGNDFGEANWFSRVVYILLSHSGVAQICNLTMILGREDHKGTAPRKRQRLLVRPGSFLSFTVIAEVLK